jgi:hypothetical protein
MVHEFRRTGYTVTFCLLGSARKLRASMRKRVWPVSW